MSLDLLTIGQLLKETREAKGLKLEDVSNILYLRKSIIDALESGNWDKLPHQVYVKGYLNQYASYLDVADKLAEAMRVEDETEALVSSEPIEDKGNQPSRKHFTEKLHKVYPRKRFVIYGASLAVLLAVFVYQAMERRILLPLPAGTYAVSNTAYEASTKSIERSVPAVLDPKKLVVACRERTWIRIVIDETEKKEFMLNPEEMVAFNAKEGFDLLIGNAGGVTLFYNGQNVGFEGENGEVRRVRLP
jgi:transcriptional regulator with XRE-family HTH domain